MSYTLNYVNTESATYNYDKVFSTLKWLVLFVTKTHPDYTSYQVIATKA
jgi:hypothetical protein